MVVLTFCTIQWSRLLCLTNTSRFEPARIPRGPYPKQLPHHTIYLAVYCIVVTDSHSQGYESYIQDSYEANLGSQLTKKPNVRVPTPQCRVPSWNGFLPNCCEPCPSISSITIIDCDAFNFIIPREMVHGNWKPSARVQ